MRFQETEEFKEAIKKTYPNCIPFYIRLDANRKFPFFLVKSKLFGNKIINLPFLDTGFIPKNISKNDVKKIISGIKDKGIIEIRTDKSFENFEKIKKILTDEGFNAKENKHQMIIPLKKKGIEEIWKKFHKHTRNDIRKSEKSGLKTKRIEGEKELKKFYKIYLQNMKKFGTPQHSFRFFKNLFYEMEENFFGLNCYYRNKIIGSIIMLYSPDEEGYLGFNVSDFNYKKFRPNDKLYWEMIKFGIEKNLKKISLGQVDLESKDSRAKGLYNFKSKWISKPVKRIYFYYGEEKKENGNKKNKLKKLRKIWKKLPMPIIKIVGPKITSQLGI